MASIKGIILVNWVKVIRADKTGLYDKHLTEADRKIIQSTIFSTSWYPFDTFQRLFKMVTEEFQVNDRETIEKWGYDYAEKLLVTLSHLFVNETSVVHTIRGYSGVEKVFFDTGSFEASFTGEKTAQIKVSDFPNDFTGFYYMTGGWYTKVFELGGAKSVTHRYLKKSWQGEPHTIIEYSWV